MKVADSRNIGLYTTPILRDNSNCKRINDNLLRQDLLKIETEYEITTLEEAPRQSDKKYTILGTNWSHAGACENTNSNDKNSKLCRCWNVGYEHECMYDNIISYKRSNDTRTTCIKTTHIIILYTIILIFCWLVRQIIATVYAKV
jgi:hypothetical protein